MPLADPHILFLVTKTTLIGGECLFQTQALWAILKRALTPSTVILPPGGHNIAGVLGQIGAMLELAEQIEEGDIPDPEAIYVPYGSGCTTTGLVMGVALAEELGMKAFRKKGFKIVAVGVHHAIAKAHSYLNCLHWNYMPLSVAFSINQVSSYLEGLGGVPATLRASSHSVRESRLEIVTEPQYVGRYGTHSQKSLPEALAYDESAQIQLATATATTGKPAAAGGWSPLPHQWLCGHFAAKAYGVMSNRLASGEHAPGSVLFWQTKSAVQPRATHIQDESVAFESLATEGVKAWAKEGKAHSRLRQGAYYPSRYRHLTKEIPLELFKNI